MSIEVDAQDNSIQAALCPYWRKFCIKGQKILFMCVSFRSDEPPLPDIPDFPRLQKCPWFPHERAFDAPLIGETIFGPGFVRRHPDLLWVSDGVGAEGMRQLESLWQEELKRFRSG